MNNREILTTFQAAKLCGVSHKSIERWIDSGLLKGFRTPGGHRRLKRTDLLDFVTSRRTDGNGNATIEGHGPIRVLVVADDPVADPVIVGQFGSLDKYTIGAASTCFEAGILAERFKPHVIVLDLDANRLDGPAIWHHVRHDARLSGVLVVAVTDSDHVARQSAASNLYHATVVRPFLPFSLRMTVDSLLENAGFLRRVFASV